MLSTVLAVAALAFERSTVLAQDLPRTLTIVPAQHLGLLRLEELVGVEEVADLHETVWLDLIQALDVALVRITHGHAQDLEVLAFVVAHLEAADRSCPDMAARERRFVDQKQGVGMVAVTRASFRDEAIVEVVVHGRRENAIQPDRPAALVVLVLVPAAAGDLDDQLDDLREAIVIVSGHGSMVAASGWRPRAR